MTKEEWREAYIQRIVSAGVERKDAEECYEAADDHDYDSDPQMAADEELSYWDDDEGDAS